MEERNQDDVQPWTTKQKVDLVLSLLKGETIIQEASQLHGLTTMELADWKGRFLLAEGNALLARPKDEETLKEEQIKKLK